MPTLLNQVGGSQAWDLPPAFRKGLLKFRLLVLRFTKPISNLGRTL